ncbi:hypothetical protein Vadar_005577 [Vaccinium darrowii]|uniref:Uncharacterized protein n=1 Tax=Vaccinium darrowii TaxID=229202 RepID=A0ACB7WYD4_9ERIC|nr:hypothetical protein Vadar_005577 [Vaccinium darrowii]
MYSNCDVGHSKDYAGFHTATRWQRTDVLSTESPHQSSDMDMSSHDHPMIPNTLSRHVPFRVRLHKLSNSNPNSLMGGQNWRRPSPALVMPPTPLLHVKRPIGPILSAWDLIDVIQLQRKHMRSRIETVLLVLGSPFPSKALEDRPLGLGQFGHQDHDYIWRGVIAKGVTSVYRDFCVPIFPYCR